MALNGSIEAWVEAGSPNNRSALVKATHERVVRLPKSLAMISNLSFRYTARQENDVPKSIPIAGTTDCLEMNQESRSLHMQKQVKRACDYIAKCQGFLKTFVTHRQ